MAYRPLERVMLLEGYEQMPHDTAAADPNKTTLRHL